MVGGVGGTAIGRGVGGGGVRWGRQTKGRKGKRRGKEGWEEWVSIYRETVELHRTGGRRRLGAQAREAEGRGNRKK